MWIPLKAATLFSPALLSTHGMPRIFKYIAQNTNNPARIHLQKVPDHI